MKPKLALLTVFFIALPALADETPATSINIVSPIQDTRRTFLDKFAELVPAGKQTDHGTEITLTPNAGWLTMAANIDGIRVWRSNQAAAYITYKGNVPLGADMPVAHEQDLSDLKNKFAAVCAESGGAARFVPGRDGSSRVETERRWLKALVTAGLFGTHICTSEGDVTLFTIEITSRAPESTLFPPGFVWFIGARVSTPEQWGNFNKSLDKYKTTAAQLRANPQPGMRVQVPNTDAPPIQAQTKKIDSPYMVCGMIIEAKPGIVQVQFNGPVAYVPADRIFPASKNQYSLREAQIKEAYLSPDDWCLK